MASKSFFICQQEEEENHRIAIREAEDRLAANTSIPKMTNGNQVSMLKNFSYFFLTLAERETS
jgi:hypothetical protein